MVAVVSVQLELSLSAELKMSPSIGQMIEGHATLHPTRRKMGKS